MQAQNAPKGDEHTAATAPESTATAQAKAQDGPQAEPAPNPAPVVGEALAAYLRTLAQAQAARADALQAQGDVMRAQQALAQAIERAQQAQAALSALVSSQAKKSAAPDGWRLGLDGVWLPPAEAQATQ